MRIVASLGALALLVVSGPAFAVPTHHWQFEDSPGFELDSIGSATLTPEGTPTQSAIPGSGRGSEFGGVAGSMEAADLDLGDAFSTSVVSTEDFTIELLAHLDSDPDNLGYAFAGSAFGDVFSEIGWVFQTRQPSTVPTSPDQLVLWTVLGGSATLWNSQITLDVGKDYYLALAFDSLAGGGGTATFWAQNLTDGGPLETNTVSLNAGNFIGFNEIDTFVIGDDVNRTAGLDGLVDEVRLSNSALSQDALLISLPEPGGLSLLLLALGALVVVGGRGGSRRA